MYDKIFDIIIIEKIALLIVSIFFLILFIKIKKKVSFKKKYRDELTEYIFNHCPDDERKSWIHFGINYGKYPDALMYKYEKYNKQQERQEN